MQYPPEVQAIPPSYEIIRCAVIAGHLHLDCHGGNVFVSEIPAGQRGGRRTLGRRVEYDANFPASNLKAVVIDWGRHRSDIENQRDLQTHWQRAATANDLAGRRAAMGEIITEIWRQIQRYGHRGWNNTALTIARGALATPPGSGEQPLDVAGQQRLSQWIDGVHGNGIPSLQATPEGREVHRRLTANLEKYHRLCAAASRSTVQLPARTADRRHRAGASRRFRRGGTLRGRRLRSA